MNLTVFFRRWLANPAVAPGATFRTTLQLLHHLAIALALAARPETRAPPNFRRQRVALRSEPPVD